jgi:hypothetical protein
MAMFVVPKELAVVLNARETTNKVESADGDDVIALGFVSYRDADTNQIHHKSSMDKWGDKNMLRFSYINEPTTGFRVVGFVSRWTTSNKFIRIEDPRGFQFEVSIDNFVDLLRETTIVNAIIQDKVVYGWDDAGISLYKEGSEKYNEGIDNFVAISEPNISIKDITIGTIVKLKNGRTVQWCGPWYYIEYDWNDYIFHRMEGTMPPSNRYNTPPDIKRGQLIKENGAFYFISSLTIKRIVDATQDFDESSFLTLVRQEFTVKYKKWQADKEIAKVIPERDWQDPRRAQIYKQFGLDEYARELLIPMTTEKCSSPAMFALKGKFAIEMFDNAKFEDLIKL